jgi:2-polyprenyl-3-methyl-5-hydroxy-6-metoxy-1,4-benzoquinol methylase
MNNAQINCTAKPASTVVYPLGSEETVVSWISEISGQSADTVLLRLRQEYDSPGTNEQRGFAAAGLERHVWSNGLEDFYRRTDAFLYELAVWNCNRLKLRMRKWLANYLTGSDQSRFNILCIGDGLGFDSVYLSQIGHTVTYFEMAGFTESFARKVFAENGGAISVLTDPAQIPRNEYDVVICLDVLEHIHQPGRFVEDISGYIRPGGRLIVHAPFYMVCRTSPTHLRSNRKYSGGISLYTKCNLRFIDGDFRWNPLVFEKPADGLAGEYHRNLLKLFFIRLIGLYFMVGRFWFLPFLWIKYYRRGHRNWFGKFQG